ncbi:hypothetical protein [Marinobacter sp. JSM 1782161]|uniref:hypothetical protein n=1 Tax=Marinobacter sp. JSM 1782161 TaxID=2685906 RepID=UPI001403C989|nr:hypothetical protein [Marinobacter sp. JSM 1782161]
MSSALEKYLAAIREGRPINFEAFRKLLPASIAGRWSRHFDVERVSQQRWRVRIVDTSVAAELEQLARVPGTRREAALQGDSHRRETATAFVLVYHEALIDPRPDVVCLNAGRCHLGFAPKATALVVENEDNFAQARQMLAFAASCLGEPLALDCCDVVLGGGNRVLRAPVMDWLAGYDRVLCAFDYDLGGLKMFQALRERLGDRAHFLQPPDWTLYHAGFCKTPGSPQRLIEAIERAGALGFTGLAERFRETRQFMEQEIILDEH